MKHEKRPRPAGRQVGAIHRFSQRYFAAQMERLGLPPTAFPLISRLLRHDNVSQDEIAGHFLMDKATITRTLAKLEQAGLITRTVDEDDRRVKRVQVTEAARALEPQIRAVARQWSELLLDGFTPEEREQALAYLERMTANARAHWADAVPGG
jgi:DNA-binding MarR family transcriptional regulator